MIFPIEFSLEIYNKKFSDKPIYLIFSNDSYDFTFKENKDIPIITTWEQESLHFSNFFYMDPKSENPVLLNKHNFLGYFILNELYIGLFWTQKIKNELDICYFTIKNIDHCLKLLQFFEKNKIVGLNINVELKPFYIFNKKNIEESKKLIENEKLYLECLNFNENNNNPSSNNLYLNKKNKIINLQEKKNKDESIIIDVKWNPFKNKNNNLIFDIEDNNYKEFNNLNSENEKKYNLWKLETNFHLISF